MKRGRGAPKRSEVAEEAYLWLTRLYLDCRCNGSPHTAAFKKAVEAFLDHELPMMDFPQKDRSDGTFRDNIYKRVPDVLKEFQKEGRYPDDAIKRVLDSLAKHGKKN